MPVRVKVGEQILDVLTACSQKPRIVGKSNMPISGATDNMMRVFIKGLLKMTPQQQKMRMVCQVSFGVGGLRSLMTPYELIKKLLNTGMLQKSYQTLKQQLTNPYAFAAAGSFSASPL